MELLVLSVLTILGAVWMVRMVLLSLTTPSYRGAYRGVRDGSITRPTPGMPPKRPPPPKPEPREVVLRIVVDSEADKP